MPFENTLNESSFGDLSLPNVSLSERTSDLGPQNESGNPSSWTHYLGKEDILNVTFELVIITLKDNFSVPNLNIIKCNVTIPEHTHPLSHI